MRSPKLGLLLAVLISHYVHLALAKSIPTNIAGLRSSIIKQGTCSKVLKTGFRSAQDDPAEWSYCGDHLSEGVMYVSGPQGKLVNMDIDCDGTQHGLGDDGRCGSSRDTQSETSFKDTIAQYGKGIKDLNAYVHPYVVFGNVGTKSGYTTFDPTKNGVEPLSLMAVVCGDQMFYGIFGDTNGDDALRAVVGEASISMATLCFGKGINGNNGHDEDDVLILAFIGKEAVPGKDGALWDAKSAEEFVAYEAFDNLGDKLVARIERNSGNGYNSSAGDEGNGIGNNGDGESSAVANAHLTTTLFVVLVIVIIFDVVYIYT